MKREAENEKWNDPEKVHPYPPKPAHSHPETLSFPAKQQVETNSCLLKKKEITDIYMYVKIYAPGNLPISYLSFFRAFAKPQHGPALEPAKLEEVPARLWPDQRDQPKTCGGGVGIGGEMGGGGWGVGGGGELVGEGGNWGGDWGDWMLGKICGGSQMSREAPFWTCRK